MGGMMGGGGGPSIPQRNLSSELGQILKFGKKFGNQSFNLDQILAPRYLGLNLKQEQAGIAGQPLLAELNKQSLSELQAGAGGGDLTSPEADRIARTTAAGFASRGNAFSPAALGTELLNREQYATQRQAQRRGFAQDVLKLNLGTTTGLGGISQNPGAQGIYGGLLGYGQDVFSSNQSAAADQSIAGANKSAGTTSGVVSTVGSVVGAAAAAY